MGRRGKVKYKDVVKKPPQPKIKKKPKPRKTYSLYKQDFKHNSSKRKNNFSEETTVKRQKLQEKKIEEIEHFSDSSEEDNALNNLLNTFCDPVSNKKSLAIESSSESDDEELEEEQEHNDKDDDLQSAEEEELGTDSGSDTNEKETEGLNTDTKNLDETDESVYEDAQDDDGGDSEIEVELTKENETDIDNDNDPFAKHLFYSIHDSVLDSLQSTPPSVENFSENWPELGKLFIQIPKSDNNIQNEITALEKNIYSPLGVVPKRISKSSKLEELFIKSQIISNVKKVNKTITGSENLSPLQSEMFSIINNYQDFYYPHRTFNNCEEIRFIYCLHAVNHILKTRLKVIHHNARLSKKDDVPDEFRDQGLVRPKVSVYFYKLVTILLGIKFTIIDV